MATQSEPAGGISKINSETLERKTGKTWSAWIQVLDDLGAAEMTHAKIAKQLAESFQISGWWAQTITVGYERAKGLRKKHQMADGFSISRSKTIEVPITQLFAAWQDADSRSRWLKSARMDIRKSTPNKSMRIEWQNPASRLDVYFYAKGDHKSQVVVQQSKLAGEADAAEMKTYWQERLAALKRILEMP